MHGIIRTSTRLAQLVSTRPAYPDTHQDDGDSVWLGALHVIPLEDTLKQKLRVGILVESSPDRVMDVDEHPRLMWAYLIRNKLDILIRKQRTGHMIIMCINPTAIRWIKKLRTMLNDADQQISKSPSRRMNARPVNPATVHRTETWVLEKYSDRAHPSPTALLVMNGGFTQWTPPIGIAAQTGVRTDWVLSMLRYVAGGVYFEPSRSHDCKRGICTHSVAAPCPMNKYSLSQCETVQRNFRLRLQAHASHPDLDDDTNT